jgi:hypothetical protein
MPNIFKKLVGKALTLVGSDHLVSGTVIKKNDYKAGTGEKFNTTVLGKGQTEVVVFTTTPSLDESYSLTVQGLDKMGNKEKEEIYVTGLEYSTTKVGDPYTSK